MVTIYPQTKFLGSLDLKWGVFTFNAILSLAVYLYMQDTRMKFHDWLVYLLICCPAPALLVLNYRNSIADTKDFAYCWANWYFAALAFVVGSFYIGAETIVMFQLISKVSDSAIQFRVAEAGNPLRPELIGGGAHSSFADSDFVKQSFESLPDRYYAIQALFHSGEGFESDGW